MATRNGASPSKPLAAGRRTPKWVLIALASGGFAALNGAFAKLTTADNTTSLAHAIVPESSPAAPYFAAGLRATFFGLNLACNAVMWALFTRALATGSSATRVSVINTSANFLVTAVLGWMWFGEALSGLWFLGAAGLVGGAAIVGRSRDDGDAEEDEMAGATSGAAPEDRPGKTPGEGEGEDDTLLLDLDADGGEAESRVRSPRKGYHSAYDI